MISVNDKLYHKDSKNTNHHVISDLFYVTHQGYGGNKRCCRLLQLAALDDYLHCRNFQFKYTGFYLIINFLKPVILPTTENKLFFFGIKKSLWLEITLWPCCRHVFFQVENDDKHVVNACCLWLCSVGSRSRILASENPKSLLHSFCHSPLPPVFSPNAHRLHSPFNPIFTDLEIAFHEL